ncbi:nitrous oxide reductase accessory protein NosL [Nitratiruptor tergarcus]|uniref:Nitrous oxide reductase accessory protein NosL n=1 Tax=Nitratiruptor tergarcus DSM 16512 TaxID=1069081 RepID=A0A1W1WQV3_9BACT|nr:nitrous oxide reductase accessory protein NosL [Nitratiruptor tergarcus]SMC08585.1 Nitrous oxide reductase accessory protein NosL [Nitratiruptor tergarcus DSM 16512]
MKKIFAIFLFVTLLFGQNASKDSKSSQKATLDPIYHLDVNKNPKFQAKIELANGKTILFCCPKSMFYFYLRPYEFPEYKIKKETDFKKLLVKDYISGEWIKAEGALYVFGSRLQGPKGDDLIPVRNKDTLNIFRLKYGGSKVLTFPEVVHKGVGLIYFLDAP